MGEGLVDQGRDGKEEAVVKMMYGKREQGRNCCRGEWDRREREGRGKKVMIDEWLHEYKEEKS